MHFQHPSLFLLPTFFISVVAQTSSLAGGAATSSYLAQFPPCAVRIRHHALSDLPILPVRILIHEIHRLLASKPVKFLADAIFSIPNASAPIQISSVRPIAARELLAVLRS